MQRRATKFILNDYISSYKSRLQQLNLLPLIYELNDLMFLIKSLNTPTDNFDIKNFISFNTNSTRSGSHLKLCHPRTVCTAHHHFCFNRIVRLRNHLSVINLSLPPYVIKQKLTKHLWGHFTVNFNSDQSCSSFICYVHATDAQDNQSPPIFSLFNDTELQIRNKHIVTLHS